MKKTPQPIRIQREEGDYYIQTTIGLYQSEAWWSISSKARDVYSAIASRYARINNGDIGMTQAQIIERMGGGSPVTIVDALRQLETTGIIVRTFMGHRGIERWRYTKEELSPTKAAGAAKEANASKPKGIASKWLLTDCPTFDHYGNETAPCYDYRRWKPGMDMRTEGSMPVSRRGDKAKIKPTTNKAVTTPKPKSKGKPAPVVEEPKPDRMTVVNMDDWRAERPPIVEDATNETMAVLEALDRRFSTEINDDDVPF